MFSPRLKTNNIAKLRSDITDKPINELFDEFLGIFSKIITKHAPLRKLTRKQMNFKKKPWLTSGLLRSIKRKIKMFKSLHKNFNHGAFIFYKRYQ